MSFESTCKVNSNWVDAPFEACFLVGLPVPLAVRKWSRKRRRKWTRLKLRKYGGKWIQGFLPDEVFTVPLSDYMGETQWINKGP
jgi:hypothetical protein